MEVRLTEVSSASLGELRPPIATTSSVNRDDEGAQYSRLAHTAAGALRVPFACISLPVRQTSRERRYYGPGAETYAEFVDSVFEEAKESAPFIGPAVQPAGGDGAAIRTVAALPLLDENETTGVLCIFDYRERTFSPSELRLLRQFADLATAELKSERELSSLRLNGDRFRTVTENALDVVAVIDSSFSFTYVSQAATGVFGRGPGETIGRSILDHVLEEDRERLRAALEGGMQAADIVDVEYRYAHPSEGLKFLRLRGRRLGNQLGADGLLLNVRDTTDRVHFEEELRKSRDRAEEMSKLKSVFLTNISHETRTPLTTILGFAEILEEEVTEEQKEFVHLIQQGGKRLLDTLMSILDLARLESSSFRCEPEYFDLGSKIFDTCLLLEPLAQEKDLTLKVNLPDKPIKVFLDISAVERTVSNLVSNAIKFTAEGTVTVSLEADDSDVLIHVADTGIGIGADFMPYLFEEFKQESEGLARVHEGSGLGLPITKRLVELMKGKIMADSEKGFGSVFTVALPKNGETKRAAANGQSGGEAARPRVLVVEDNADTRTLVNHLLRKSYDVACASNGEEALELAGESSFDVLLVDINLGKGKSGEDVLHEVKKLPGYEDTPIVAVTAYAMPGDKERFFAEGFDDYVSKPFSKQRLLEALESVLE